MTELMEMAANRDIMNSIDLGNTESLRLQLQYDKKSVPANKYPLAPLGIFSVDVTEEARISIQQNMIMKAIADCMRVPKNNHKVSLI